MLGRFIRMVVLAGVGVLLVASSSTVKFTTGNPRPNIDLDESASALCLELSPSIQDSLAQPQTDGMVAFEVTGWRKTLAKGFKAGFGPYYKLSSTSGCDLTLSILETRFELVPAAVTSGGAVVAAAAQITYKARLLDRSRNILGRSTGTVASKKSTSDRFAASALADSAVETLYEVVARELFHDVAPAEKQARGTRNEI